MKFSKLPFFILVAFLCGSAPGWAQNIAAVQESMKERLPRIDAMKLEGVVGENNRGYLEARQDLSAEQRKVLEAENADRTKLYAHVANRAGVDAAQVGVQRARQIRERSPRGIWLQSPDGKWFKK